MARRHEYDQHFLRSPRFVAELIGHSNLKKRDTVYDFGAGSGVISSVLARRVAHVVAVENESAALDKLRTNLRSAENCTIVAADMLEVPLPTDTYKVFANPPFSLSAALVQRLALSDTPAQAIYLIVQRQFARKLVPSDQHFTSALGSKVAFRYEARIRRPLKRTDFTPPPAVDTVLLELKMRAQPLAPPVDVAGIDALIDATFHNPKTLARDVYSRAGVSPEKKPSELTVDEWTRLYRYTGLAGR